MDIPTADVVEHLQKCFDELHKEFLTIWPCVNRLIDVQRCVTQVTGLSLSVVQKKTEPREEILLYIKAIIFHSGNQIFNQAITQFYKQCFKAFDVNTKASLGESTQDSC